ncbi:Scr1 family TA system antitoxin-like transcriptional regulator [Nonomuraea fuscirosea]|uniref:Transcriptional regulator with XRE-family HTH domain n=1 Tax=Nonomuraea fuscirosea TaxID=1291556 RepID=A0A2T0NAG6_9ACTN|nr:helix-turn-helix transcriptional regulator [Nonomuraea fuscirosea]PRX69994.1 transcriptional regulator with XRE-family HTH domain [Nonomuraea fuscirosea]WSA54354.1 Scr1 family TA system antitoxin-like transcriptional regulator [Nonomuraea fuscirosea]
MANFAERLDLALTKRGFTGAQVASALTEAGIPITRAYVSQLRTGKQTNPTLQVLRALATCLQVSVGWLVGDDFLESGSVEDLQLRAATIGLSASGLSEGSLAVLRGVVELARKAEGLPEEPEPTSDIPEAVAPLSGPQRRALGKRLHGLRLTAGLSVEQVETAVGKGAAAIPAIEEGRIAPAPITVERLLTVYGVSVPPIREYVLALARGEREAAWYDAQSVPVWLATGYALEQRATVIRTYHSQFVPPLLQTEEYARAAITVAGPATLGQQTVEEALALVLARQEAVARDSGVVVWAVIDESVLTRSIVGLHVQLRQLEVLIEHAKRPNVSLHVVPMEDPAYVPRTGPFTLWRFAEAFEPDVACAHGIESDTLLTDSAAVEAYHQAFTKLSVTTTTRDETFEMLNHHRERLSRSLGK